MENINITLENPSVSNVNSVLTGPQGPAGFSPIATVSKTGNVTTITITDEDGTTTATVLDGTNGADGTPNTLTIGTVSSGSTPAATITGTTPNQVLNLVLPKGDTGDNGADGITPTITIGSVNTVSPSTAASVTNSGTDTNVVLNFDIPQGVQGDDANCLSVPTIVDELPEVGDPNTFYFVPKTNTITTVTSPTVYITVTADKIGKIKDLSINGEIEQDTPPATPEALRGVVTFTINGVDYTVDLSPVGYLAKINAYQDKIFNDGDDFYLHREIGYIQSYTNEDLDGADYISTSGSLTPGDEVYYDLHDPTDTLITDETLINQLRIIKNIIYPVGSNTIITSANVTAELTIGWYEVDPYHQYDKYVYMIDTSNYEQIG